MVLLTALACHLRYAVLIVCVLLVLILFSKWTGTAPSAAVPRTPASWTATGNEVTVAYGALTRANIELFTTLVDRAQQVTAASYAVDLATLARHDQIAHLMQLAYALSYVDSAQLLVTSAPRAGTHGHDHGPNADVLAALPFTSADLEALVSSIKTREAQIHQELGRSATETNF
jgi:hypothetical protein